MCFAARVRSVQTGTAVWSILQRMRGGQRLMVPTAPGIPGSSNRGRGCRKTQRQGWSNETEFDIE